MCFFKNCFILFFAVFSVNLSAQSFEKGMVILTNGDMLTGFIQNHVYGELSHQVVFKNDRKSEPTAFRPGDVKAFVFKDGDYFESFDISFDVKTAHGWQHVSGSRFLFRLEKGGMELFELKDNGQQPLFIRKNNGELQLLCESKDGYPLYQDLLKGAFLDCAQMKMPVPIDLTVASIRPLVQDYNNCGSLVKECTVPFVQAWGFVGLSTNAIFNEYEGFNKGLSLEARPFQKGFLSHWNLGLEGQLLDYKKHKYESDIRHFKIREIAAKTRFFLPVRNSLANPYGFIGTRWRKYEQKQFYTSPLDGSRVPDGSKSWKDASWQVGIGVNAQVKRHVFRFEMSLDREVEMRLGYGFVLW